MPIWVPSLWIIPALTTLLAAILLVWRAFSARPARTGQRIGLWLAALFFTFYGPFSATDPVWPPTAWAAAINTEKNFKDLWLSMIAMLVFSISNIADNLIRDYNEISPFSKTFAPILLAIYFIAVAFGMTRYAEFSGKVLSNASFSVHWTIVWVSTVLSIFWELLIALESRD